MTATLQQHCSRNRTRFSVTNTHKGEGRRYIYQVVQQQDLIFFTAWRAVSWCEAATGKKVCTGVSGLARNVVQCGAAAHSPPARHPANTRTANIATTAMLYSLILLIATSLGKL